jgi:hypothetical protein
MKPSTTPRADLALACLAVVSVISLGAVRLVQHFSPGETLRCEITATSTAMKAGSPTVTTPHEPMTLVYRIKGDQWTLSTNGVDGQWTPMHLVNDQAYVLWDRRSDAQIDTMAIDRTTGDISGAMIRYIDFELHTTGHCTPVTGSIL